MGRFALACLLLFEILLVQAMAARSIGSEQNPVKLTVRTGVESHGTVADPPGSSPPAAAAGEGEKESGEAEAPEISREGKQKHHSSDKSVAGGGVIIGGLVTAIFAAVYCYIRVTRRRDGDKH